MGLSPCDFKVCLGAVQITSLSPWLAFNIKWEVNDDNPVHTVQPPRGAQGEEHPNSSTSAKGFAAKDEEVPGPAKREGRALFKGPGLYFLLWSSMLFRNSPGAAVSCALIRKQCSGFLCITQASDLCRTGKSVEEGEGDTSPWSCSHNKAFIFFNCRNIFSHVILHMQHILYIVCALCWKG